MQKFTRGDEVVIDWDYYHKILDVDPSVLIKVWKDTYGKFAVIERYRSDGSDIQYLVWSPKSQDNLQVEESSLSHACIEHKSRKVYHDKKEEWICPHCMD